MTDELQKRRCLPCEGGAKPLDTAQVQALLKKVNPRWSMADGDAIIAQFDFSNYYETTAFINGVAWIAHQQDHHPDISFGYKQATVRYSTHAISGLSENDFICAARIDALLDS